MRVQPREFVANTSNEKNRDFNFDRKLKLLFLKNPPLASRPQFFALIYARNFGFGRQKNLLLKFQIPQTQSI